MFTVAISELYALGMPLFVPSLELVASLRNSSTDYSLAFDRVISRPPGLTGKCPLKGSCLLMPCCAGCPLHFSNISLPPQHPKSTHQFSPEDESVAARRYWLQMADFYRWPHVTQFSSFADLTAKLFAADFAEIHQRMMTHNAKRLKASWRGWQWVFSRVRRGGSQREVPRDYTIGMRALWNEESVNHDGKRLNRSV